MRPITMVGIILLATNRLTPASAFRSDHLTIVASGQAATAGWVSYAFTLAGPSDVAFIIQAHDVAFPAQIGAALFSEAGRLISGASTGKEDAVSGPAHAFVLGGNGVSFNEAPEDGGWFCQSNVFNADWCIRSDNEELWQELVLHGVGAGTYQGLLYWTGAERIDHQLRSAASLAASDQGPEVQLLVARDFESQARVAGNLDAKLEQSSAVSDVFLNQSYHAEADRYDDAVRTLQAHNTPIYSFGDDLAGKAQGRLWMELPDGTTKACFCARADFVGDAAPGAYRFHADGVVQPRLLAVDARLPL